MGWVLSVAASGQNVRYNYAMKHDFTKLKTNVWADEGGSEIDQITAQQLRSAVDSAMAKNGFVLRSQGPSDLMLRHQASVDKEKQLTLYNTGWGYGRGWRSGPGITTGQTSTIRTGEFALDVYSTDSKQLLWRGVASDTLPACPKPQQWQKESTTERTSSSLISRRPQSRDARVAVPAAAHRKRFW